ncbi:hypothetical protein Tco_1251534, partial [Tanacetum coccineum]
FIDSDDEENDQPVAPAIEIVAPSHRESQSSGSSSYQNSLAMVVRTSTEDVPKVEEPAPKRLKVVIDIPKSMPLNFMRPTTFNNMPFDQFST